jgi:hypothetical protein
MLRIVCVLINLNHYLIWIFFVIMQQMQYSQKLIYEMQINLDSKTNYNISNSRFIDRK